MDLSIGSSHILVFTISIIYTGNTMEFLFVGHARQHMYERKITVEEVKNTVNKGMKWFCKNEGKAGRWHAKMGAVEVVFERSEKYLVVITVY